MENKPLPNFKAKLKKGKKTHAFVQPFGYPILLCLWEIREDDDFVKVDKKTKINCKNCLSIIRGEHRAYANDWDTTGLT